MIAARRIIGLVALSAIVVVAAPTAGAQTRTVTSVIGSADGLTVGVTVIPEALPRVDLDLGPTPMVTLAPEGGSVSDEVLAIDEDVPQVVSLTAATLRTSAEGGLGPAGFATAESVVEDLALAIFGNAPVAPVLEAEVISATCSSNLDGVTGETTLAGASVLGTALDVSPEPNTELVVTVAGVGEVSVTLNRQVQNPDGSLSVTALALEIDFELVNVIEGSGTLAIGPATCGVVEGVESPPAPAPAAGSAPAQAVPAQVRFTG